MLKTTGSSDSALKDDDDEVVEGSGRNLSKSKKSKNAKSGIQTHLGVMGESTFLTPNTREAFNQLRQVFTKTPILQYFNLECHIWIETNASGYVIGGVLNQMTSDYLTSDQSQWHPIAYILRKMIPAETRYKTHDNELLTIVKAFKTWHHYLKGCKHEVLVLTNHNNLRWFINTKSLSSRQVCWAQELSRYHFWIDYYQGKTKGTVDALSHFPRRSYDEEEKFRVGNTQILHYLQTSLTNASLSGLSLKSMINFLSLYQVLICGIHVFPQLRQFWNIFRAGLADENPYKASIGGIKLRLSELQESHLEAQELKSKEQLPDGWEDINGVLHHQGLPFVPEVIWTELISRHHNNFLAGHFGINKIKDLIGRKYYWPSLWKDIEAYVKGCDVCLGSKAVRHKPYGDLQSLSVPIH